MKNSLYFLVFLLVLENSPLAYAEQPLILANDGTSDYSIVIQEHPTPVEKYAAEELQHFITEMSGVVLPIIPDNAPLKDKEIILGKNKHLEQVQPSIDWSALGQEGVLIRTSGDRLILTGGNKRGTLYAVYTFLEKAFDCKWFTPTVSRIPKLPRLQVAPMDLQYVPPFAYRAVGWISASDATWAARNRVNAAAPLEEKHGGAVTILGGGHNFLSLVPPEKYFADHPEYYAEINGQRTYHKAQLCLTNPDVIEIVACAVREMLQKNPEAAYVGVGQEDWGGWCECSACKTIDDREESHAGSLVYFLNEVGKRIETDFPNVHIVSLAYQHTRKPPKTLKPRHNVIPWVCGIECCYSHPLTTCETSANQIFQRDLRNWTRLAEHVFVWDYTANFDHYIMPHPNLRVLQPNLQFFAEQNVTGVYASGNPSKGAEWGELRSYVLAKLLWDPSTNAETLIDDFLKAYYGNAAARLAEYIKLIHDKVDTDRIHCTISTSPMSPYLHPSLIAQAKALFDQAEQDAETEEIRERVRVARMPIQHVELEWSKPAYHVENNLYKALLSPATEELARRFADVAERNGITVLCEFENRTPAWHLQQIDFWKKTWDAVRLENATLRADIVPGLGGRIVSLYDKAHQHELLLGPQPDGREYPWSGGYEEYSERGGRTYGWHEAYEYRVETPGKCVILWAELPNGLRMNRRIELESNRPRLIIRSELQNTTSENKTACLRVHPIFTLGLTDDVTVSFTTLTGIPQTVPLITPRGQERCKMLLRGNDKPKNYWDARNPKLGLFMRQSFNPDEVEEMWLDWLAPRQRFFMELCSPEKVLKPQENLVITHSYEIVLEKSSS